MGIRGRQYGARGKAIREAARRGAHIVLIQELSKHLTFCKDHDF